MYGLCKILSLTVSIRNKRPAERVSRTLEIDRIILLRRVCQGDNNQGQGLILFESRHLFVSNSQ